MRGIVTAAVAAIYKEPYVSSELVDELIHGMELDVLDEGEFCHIETEYGYRGFVNRKDFIPSIATANNLYIVDSLFADVLEHPKMQSRILITLVRMSRVKFVYEENGFSKIILSSGTVGFIRSEFLKPQTAKVEQNENLFRERLIASAKKYLGVQYRWGGKTPLGIDCSGLCSIAYMDCGLKIYRDAVLKDGFPLKKIPFEKIARGDLLFLKGHVAMYMGDGFYIHSSIAKNGVAIDKLEGYKTQEIISVGTAVHNSNFISE